MRHVWKGEAKSLDALDAVAQKIHTLLPSAGVVCLRAELGAGKTTFTKALCQVLGVVDAVSSPTFSIINEYHRSEARRVFHLDCYRLEGPEEAHAIGCEEYFYADDALCIVEWPEVVEALLPTPRMEIRITLSGEVREFDVYCIE